MDHRRSSRQRYLAFVSEYKSGKLYETADGDAKPADSKPAEAEDKPAEAPIKDSVKRREYVRAYLRRLWPLPDGVALLFTLALGGAALQMVEPLFMRFIIDRVLLKAGLDAATRFQRLNRAGMLFLALIVASNLVTAFR